MKFRKNNRGRYVAYINMCFVYSPNTQLVFYSARKKGEVIYKVDVALGEHWNSRNIDSRGNWVFKIYSKDEI